MIEVPKDWDAAHQNTIANKQELSALFKRTLTMSEEIRDEAGAIMAANLNDLSTAYYVALKRMRTLLNDR